MTTRVCRVNAAMGKDFRIHCHSTREQSRDKEPQSRQSLELKTGDKDAKSCRNKTTIRLHVILPLPTRGNQSPKVIPPAGDSEAGGPHWLSPDNTQHTNTPSCCGCSTPGWEILRARFLAEQTCCTISLISCSLLPSKWGRGIGKTEAVWAGTGASLCNLDST